MTTSEMWNELVDMGVSEETLQIITKIYGYTDETMRTILVVASGGEEGDDC